jgi:cytochrome P450
MRRIVPLPDLDVAWLIPTVDTMLEYAADPANPEFAQSGPAATARLRGFLRAAIAREREHPTSGLMRHVLDGRVYGRPVDEDDILSFSQIFCVAAIETTVRLIANLVFALTERPERLQAVIDDRGLVMPAIEETLRLLPPNQFRIRYAATDVPLHGTVIPQGSKVYALIGGGNRDPRVWPHPGEFVLDRFLQPRNLPPHLSFGWGPHMCLGAHLARTETRHALTALLDRLPGLRLDPEHAVAFVGFRNRSPRELFVRWDTL